MGALHPERCIVRRHHVRDRHGPRSQPRAPDLPDAFPGHTAVYPRLFANQTVHRFHPRGAGHCASHFAGGGLAGGQWLAGFLRAVSVQRAHPRTAGVDRGAVVDRVRHHLRHSGF